MTEPIEWIGTPEACARLGVTLRTLYRFIDEGQLPAYKMGRVIRLQAREVDAFIQNARIVPGTLEHLYPDPRGQRSERAGVSEVAGRPLGDEQTRAASPASARGTGARGHRGTTEAGAEGLP
ncbi:MAG TPA: helix-turn-helix domain-containing protein [Acidimicrobiales bacterium]|nr:helix-turn-helix domain-containing protein [Acidimicrobiales bacterium]